MNRFALTIVVGLVSGAVLLCSFHRQPLCTAVELSSAEAHEISGGACYAIYQVLCPPNANIFCTNQLCAPNEEEETPEWVCPDGTWGQRAHFASFADCTATASSIYNKRVDETFYCRFTTPCSTDCWSSTAGWKCKDGMGMEPDLPQLRKICVQDPQAPGCAGGT